eukprot:COSAG04_NODE_15537_length_529_cov_0.576744_2_plen_42_part_01
MIVQRQARDKHTESTQQAAVLSQEEFPQFVEVVTKAAEKATT